MDSSAEYLKRSDSEKVLLVLWGVEFPGYKYSSMMNLLEKDCEVQTLSNQDLLTQTKVLAETEREIGIRILHRLQEINHRRLASFRPEYPLKRESEKVRVLNERETELKLVLGAECMKNLERIKDLMAHQNWNLSYAELIKEMSEIVLDKIDPARKPIRETTVVSEEDKKESLLHPGEVALSASMSQAPFLTSSVKKRRAYISVFKRREALKKAGYRCTFRSVEGHRCTETRGLQIEHLIPVAKNGTDDPENLSILCKSHNLFRAMKVFGPFIRPEGKCKGQ